jgi:hypothetical protein
MMVPSVPGPAAAAPSTKFVMVTTAAILIAIIATNAIGSHGASWNRPKQSKIEGPRVYGVIITCRG